MSVSVSEGEFVDESPADDGLSLGEVKFDALPSSLKSPFDFCGDVYAIGKTRPSSSNAGTTRRARANEHPLESSPLSVRTNSSSSAARMRGPLMPHEHECSVLVIYCGGTAGMVMKSTKNDGPGSSSLPCGLAPDTDFLFRKIRNMEELQHPDMPLVFFCQLTHLVDSADAGPEDWLRYAKIVEHFYQDFDGFVFVHGTDTMAYTASALSFIFENLGKPVILTGAQLPFNVPHSDARRNIATAIYYCCFGCLAEVCVFFDTKLLRGNRAVKERSPRDILFPKHCRSSWSNGFMAFDTPNFPALGDCKIQVQLQPHLMLSPPRGRFKICRDLLDAVIMIVNVTPGFDAGLLEAFVPGAEDDGATGAGAGVRMAGEGGGRAEQLSSSESDAGGVVALRADERADAPDHTTRTAAGGGPRGGAELQPSFPPTPLNSNPKPPPSSSATAPGVVSSTPVASSTPAAGPPAPEDNSAAAGAGAAARKPPAPSGGGRGRGAGPRTSTLPHALILLTFGSGTTRSSMAAVIKKLVDREIVVVAASQCARGRVELGKYQVGEALAAAGVLSAFDMTPEACFAKLAYLFAKKLSPAEVRSAFARDLRGELGGLGLSGEDSKMSALSSRFTVPP